MSQLLLDNPFILLLVIVWTVAWKGVALWRAARRNEKWWFIALLVLNTLAILEMIYIFFFSKRGSKPENQESKGSQQAN